MSKHTPGPWEIKDGFLKERGPTGMYLARFEESSGLGYAAKANARLIAAAPDLLAALKFCALALDSHVDIERRTARETIRAAIAKAEGA